MCCSVLQCVVAGLKLAGNGSFLIFAHKQGAVCCTVVAGLKLVGNGPCLTSALLTNKVQCVTVCCKFVAVCCSVL